MTRLLLLLLFVYLFWRFYRRVAARGRRAALPPEQLRLEPDGTAFAIHHVSGAPGESFRLLNPELSLAGGAQTPLAVLEHGSESAAGSTYLVGSVQNTGERAFAEVTVELGLYDRGGELLGKLSAAKENLAPGHVWSYRVKVRPEEATLYRVAALWGIYMRNRTAGR